MGFIGLDFSPKCFFSDRLVFMTPDSCKQLLCLMGGGLDFCSLVGLFHVFQRAFTYTVCVCACAHICMCVWGGV